MLRGRVSTQPTFPSGVRTRFQSSMGTSTGAGGGGGGEAVKQVKDSGSGFGDGKREPIAGQLRTREGFGGGLIFGLRVAFALAFLRIAARALSGTGIEIFVVLHSRR